MLARELPYTGCQLNNWIATGRLKAGVHYWEKNGVLLFNGKAIDETVSALRKVHDRVPSFYEHQVEPPTAEDLKMLDLFRPCAYLGDINSDRLSVFGLRRLFQAGYVNLRSVKKKLLVEVVNNG